MKKIQLDLLAGNVSWVLDDLELYDNQYGFHESFGFTLARLVTLIMAIIVHRAFYKLMNRLPGRPVNQMIYPHMVRCTNNFVPGCLGIMVTRQLLFCCIKRQI